MENPVPKDDNKSEGKNAGTTKMEPYLGQNVRDPSNETKCQESNFDRETNGGGMADNNPELENDKTNSESNENIKSEAIKAESPKGSGEKSLGEENDSRENTEAVANILGGCDSMTEGTCNRNGQDRNSESNFATLEEKEPNITVSKEEKLKEIKDLCEVHQNRQIEETDLGKNDVPKVDNAPSQTLQVAESTQAVQIPDAVSSGQVPEQAESMENVQRTVLTEVSVPENKESIESTKPGFPANENLNTGVLADGNGDGEGTSDVAASADKQLDSAKSTAAVLNSRLETSTNVDNMEDSAEFGDFPSDSQREADNRDLGENMPLKPSEEKETERAGRSVQESDGTEKEESEEPKEALKKMESGKYPDSPGNLKSESEESKPLKSAEEMEGGKAGREDVQEPDGTGKEESKVSAEGLEKSEFRKHPDSLGGVENEFSSLNKYKTQKSITPDENLEKKQLDAESTLHLEVPDVTIEKEGKISRPAVSDEKDSKETQILCNRSKFGFETTPNDPEDMTAKISESTQSIKKFYGALTGLWKHSGSAKRHAEVMPFEQPKASSIESAMVSAAETVKTLFSSSETPAGPLESIKPAATFTVSLNSGADTISLKDDRSETTSGCYSLTTSAADDSTSLNSLNTSMLERPDSDSTSETSLVVTPSSTTGEAVKELDESLEKADKSKNKKGKTDSTNLFSIGQRVRFISTFRLFAEVSEF